MNYYFQLTLLALMPAFSPASPEERAHVLDNESRQEVVFVRADPEDRAASLQQYLKESEQYFMHALVDLSEAHWTYRLGADQWSISNCAEHILKAEEAILQGIRAKVRAEDPVDKAETSTDDEILNILYDRVNKKVKTRESFEPTGAWATKDEFLAAYNESRKALNRFLENNQANLHQYFSQSPAGEVSLHQMLLVLAGHTARHTHQIEEIRDELGLPTASLVFGGSVKVNVPAAERENIQRLFGDILLLDIDEQQNYDRVLFDGDGFVAFVYHDDESKLLPREVFANSMQAGLRTTPAYYESIKRRIIASGAEVYTPEYPVDPMKDFYFYAPGGQVFRLLKVEESTL